LIFGLVFVTWLWSWHKRQLRRVDRQSPYGLILAFETLDCKDIQRYDVFDRHVNISLMTARVSLLVHLHLYGTTAQASMYRILTSSMHAALCVLPAVQVCPTSLLYCLVTVRWVLCNTQSLLFGSFVCHEPRKQKKLLLLPLLLY